MKYFWLIFIAILLSLDAHSEIVSENTSEALDLKFPDLKTGTIFQLSTAPAQQTLLVFWRTDCEPCLKEFPLLNNFSTQHPPWRVLGVSLSDKKSTLQFWQKQQITFPTLINDGFPGELLKKFGNPLGAVPYVVMLRADRSLCWSSMGQLTEEQLQQGWAACRIHA